MKNNTQNTEQSFLTRHSTPARNKTAEDPQSSEYNGLTEMGVKKAAEKAKSEILDLIKKAPKGVVVFIGAASDQPRTKQTVEIYGNALQEVASDNNIRVITKEEISGISQNGAIGFTATLKQIKSILDKESKNKKIVIAFPLQIKGLSYGYKNRWMKDGKKTEYFKELLAKHNQDYTAAGLDWLKNRGILIKNNGQEIHGPEPAQIAKEMLASLERLRIFATTYTDRPVIIGGVGHQWDLDSLITYLATDKQSVDYEDFKKITSNASEPFIGESEMFDFNFEDESIDLNYRSKTWSSKKDG